MSRTRARLARVLVPIAAAALTVGLVASSAAPVAADAGSPEAGHPDGGNSPGEDQQTEG